MSDYIQFPKDFIFGTATASYQIEGAWNEDGKGESIWDRYTHTPGKHKSGDTGDVACDHYHRYQEDVDLMKEIGINAYRFSISWPRIFPEGNGTLNQKGIDFYSRLVDKLLEAGISPYVTLFHWDLPQNLEEKYGGFSSRECVKIFADYAQTVAKHLGDRVKNWITFNEPWVHAMAGYLIGYHAPEKKNPWAAFNNTHNQLLANGLALQAIKSVQPDNRVGITLSLAPVYPGSDNEKDRQAAILGDQFRNGLFLDPLFKGVYPEKLWKKAWLIRPTIKEGDMEIIKAPIDFLGINNYTREQAYYKWYVPFFQFWMSGVEVAETEFVKDGVQYTSMGWEVYPDSLYELLIRMKNEYGNPLIYITENGASFEDKVEKGEIVRDTKRVEFLKEYTKSVHKALKEGVNVKGYFVWSLLDNFEWAEGYSKRFGIIYVDYQTQKRIIKESGHWYSGLIKAAKGT